MKKNIVSLLFSVVLLMVVFVSSIAAPVEQPAAEGNKTVVVGFSNWSRRFEFYVDMETGMQEFADKNGIDLIIQDPNGDLNEQTKQLENFISRKVDGIIIVPIDSQAAGTEVEMVNEAGIPLVSVDIEVTGGGVVLSLSLIHI